MQLGVSAVCRISVSCTWVYGDGILFVFVRFEVLLAVGLYWVDLWVGSCVLHGESSKRMAPARNTTDRKHLELTETTANRHNSQTKHQAPSKGQPKRQVA